MKSIFLTYLFILNFVLLSCDGHNKQKIVLSAFNDQTRNKTILTTLGQDRILTYDTKNAKFIFQLDSLIEYCNGKDSTEHNNFIYKQVLQYINRHKSDSITISDTLGKVLVPDSIINFSGKADLIWVRDQKSEFSNVTDAIDWALLDFVKNGEIKVYDKKTGKFASFIYLDEVETSTHGAIYILLPNDSIIFSKLRWIN
jgi:hypothetical protein